MINSLIHSRILTPWEQGKTISGTGNLAWEAAAVIDSAAPEGGDFMKRDDLDRILSEEAILP